MKQVTPKDIILAATLGAAVAVGAVAPSSPGLIRDHITLALLLSSFLIPRLCSPICVAAFLGTAFTLGGGALGFETLRIALFSLLVAALRGEPISAFPLLVISPLWMLVFFGNILPAPSLRGLFPAPSVPLSYRAGLEICMVSLGGLLAGVRPISQLLNTGAKPLPMRTVLSYLLLVLPMLLIGGALSLAFLRTGATPKFLLGLLGPDLRMATLGGLLLSFLLNATAIIIARDLTHALIARPIVGSGRSSRHGVSTTRPALRGFLGQAYAFQDSLARPSGNGTARDEIKPLEDRVKQLALELADEHAIRVRRDNERERLLEILDIASWGSMIVRPDDSIAHMSDSLRDLFDLPNRTTIPPSLDVLKRHKTRWGEEILELLVWAKQEADSLVLKGPRVYRSPHFEEASLTLAVGAIVRESLAGSGTRGGRSDARSATRDVTLILLTHKERDLRPVQLRFLTPSVAETGGNFAEESLAGIAEDLHQLAKVCKELDDPLRLLRLADKGFLKESPLGQQLLRVLATVEKLSTASTERTKQLTSFAEPNRELIEEIQLAPLLSSGFSYLFALLGLEDPPFEDQPTAAQRIAVRYPPEEMFAFIHYYISLARYLLPRAKRMVGRIELEEITGPTGALLGGMSEGTYASIVLSHEGQSVPGNVLAAQENPLRNTEQGGTIETSLFLLSRQIKRLGGLISVTSSEAKGTAITIYLPLELPRKRRAATIRAERPESGFFPTIGSPQKITLVLARDPATGHRLGGALERNGLVCTVKLFDELLFDLDESLGFSGLGFGGGDQRGSGLEGISGRVESLQTSDGAPGSTQARGLDLSAYGSLVAELNGAPLSARELLLSETAANPTLLKIALSAARTQAEDFITMGWNWIATPVSEEALVAAVRTDHKAPESTPTK